jgi:hypothetical protein
MNSVDPLDWLSQTGGILPVEAGADRTDKDPIVQTIAGPQRA